MLLILINHTLIRRVQKYFEVKQEQAIFLVNELDKFLNKHIMEETYQLGQKIP